MTNDNWHTLRVPPEAYDQAKEQKENAGRTWGEQVVRPENDAESESIDVERLADELAECVTGKSLNPEALADALADELDEYGVSAGVDAQLAGIAEQLATIERAASTAEERTGSIERQLEDMGGR